MPSLSYVDMKGYHHYPMVGTIMATPQQGSLYVVATPIGNLEDITLRAVRILGEVDLVAAEDTRHTRKLLSHLGLSKPLISYFKDKEASRSEDIISHLQNGSDVALVSDAGTPAISDPGSILVRRCHEESIVVIPIPGPSALTSALSVAGFVSPTFTFLAFLPSQLQKRRKILQAHVQQQHVLVFYESPKRICKTLTDCLEIFGQRQLFIGRELSKMHEEIRTGTIAEILEDFASRKSIKGEFVVAIGEGGDSTVPDSEDVDDILCWYRDHSGLSLKDAVAKVAQDLNYSRSEAYKLALKIWGKK